MLAKGKLLISKDELGIPENVEVINALITEDNLVEIKMMSAEPIDGLTVKTSNFEFLTNYSPKQVPIPVAPTPIPTSVDLSSVVNFIGLNDYAVGDGTDETANIQRALNNAQGKAIVFPYGSSYFTKSLEIPRDVTVVAIGAKIYNTLEHQTFLNIGSNVKIIGLEIEGAGNSIPNSKGKAINILGTNSDYKYNINLVECNFHDIGYHGVYAKFTRGINIERSTLRNLGYAGITGSSVSDVYVDKCLIKGVKGLTNGNAYGVVFTRTNSDSFIDYPPSENCTVSNSTIEDVLTWEGLDTHGGIGIRFIRNTIRNCKSGIIITDAGNALNQDVFASQRCVAEFNEIFGIGKGYGINCTGNSSQPSSGNKIDDNYLFRCGIESNPTAGAIRLGDTISTSANRNVLEECYAIGLHIYNNNLGVSAIDNTIIDIQDKTISATGLLVGSSNNTGIIDNNKFILKNADLNVFVGERAIRFNPAKGNDFALGINHSNYKVHISGLSNITSTGLVK